MPALLPAMVEVVEADPAAPPPALLPAERRLVQAARDTRRREFAAGRGCARRALAGLGVHGFALLCGPRREPLWPAGVVGSITHTAGYVAAAVGPAGSVALLGIDAELVDAVGDDLGHLVCTPREHARARTTSRGLPWHALLFSAKESVFKATFPVWRTELAFGDLDVTLHPAAGTFAATAATARARPLATDLDRMRGRFGVGARHVFTAAWL